MVQKCNVFNVEQGRAHVRFPGMLMTPLPSLQKDKLFVWMRQKHKQQLSCSVMGHQSEERGEDDDT